MKISLELKRMLFVMGQYEFEIMYLGEKNYLIDFIRESHFILRNLANRKCEYGCLNVHRGW